MIYVYFIILTWAGKWWMQYWETAKQVYSIQGRDLTASCLLVYNCVLKLIVVLSWSELWCSPLPWADEDFGNDFLSSWSSAKMGKEAIDFDVETVPRIGKKSFDFDKLWVCSFHSFPTWFNLNICKLKFWSSERASHFCNLPSKKFVNFFVEGCWHCSL